MARLGNVLNSTFSLNLLFEGPLAFIFDFFDYSRVPWLPVAAMLIVTLSKLIHRLEVGGSAIEYLYCPASL
jgi:hypothetical protein